MIAVRATESERTCSMTDAEAVIQKGRGSYAVFEDDIEERAQRLRSPGERCVFVKGAKCPYDASILVDMCSYNRQGV